MINKIYYRKGYKYQLHDNYEVQINIKPIENIETEYIRLSIDGLLFIKEGYAWDGPSGPTIDTKSFMRASLVHDALYQLIRMGKLTPDTRAFADEELKRICLEDGMYKIIAAIVFDGVRLFGHSSINPKIEKEIIEAP